MQGDSLASELIEALLSDDIAGHHHKGGEDALAFVDVSHPGLRSHGSPSGNGQHSGFKLVKAVSTHRESVTKAVSVAEAERDLGARGQRQGGHGKDQRGRENRLNDLREREIRK